MKPVTHLHVHSHYSLLNALPKVKELIATAKADGATALAITEDGNMYSAIEFYKACRDAGIKPILGSDLFVAPRRRTDKEYKTDDANSRLIVLAETTVGYKHMIKLVTKGFLEGFFNVPRVDYELLGTYKEGLIAILPAQESSVSHALRVGDSTAATERLHEYKAIFGSKLYIELTHHPEILDHEELMEHLLALAQREEVPVLAAHEIYYLKPEDKIGREISIKIRTNTHLDDTDHDKSEDYSFIDSGRMCERFSHVPVALENTQKVADMCNVTLDIGAWTFPTFPLAPGKTYDEILREDAYAGLTRRNINPTDEMTERIEYELGVIRDKGYSPYFLVVSDLMRHAARVGILTNTRGSAAGSFVSYLIDITSINPLDYALPFERFLNPERPSPPDIDMDIPDNRRDDMIAYARDTYGKDSLAQIGTFGTMAARAAVRDVARALGYPYGMGDKVAKMIPFGAQGFPMTIARALEMEPDLAALYKDSHEAREIIDYAQQIEGNARHVGIHAAGVVVSPTADVTDYVPVQLDPKGTGKLVTQYDMHAVEDAGLLKFDFLGLKNLAVLADAVKRVKKLQGVEVDVNNLNLFDEKTYKMLAEGHTMGVFQLASSGMTKWLTELKPSTIHDINAMVALYRPGPMDFIPDYIARKRDPAKVVYIDPRLEEYLAPTFGILIYQDDVMLIAVELAGYSWGEADKFRKAMGKKIPEEMAKQKDKFHDGCVERGMKDDVAHQLWQMIETFAAYGFNKAHAVSYGNLAYKTAYMKANYPLEYMAALLTADAGDVGEVARIVEECKSMGIPVLPPNINDSLGVFSVVQDAGAIRFGLNSIKNFGEGIAHSIVEERKTHGTYTSLGDFLTRVGDKNLNKRSLESLITCGALDIFAERGRLLANLDHMLEFHKEAHNTPHDQDSLFGATVDTASDTIVLAGAAQMPLGKKLGYEKELLGLYISGHPLDAHKDKIAHTADIAKSKERLMPGAATVLAGLIDEVKVILTKKGEKMAFVKISDYADSVELVVFPRVFSESQEVIRPGMCVLAKGKLSLREGEFSFLVDAFKAL